MIERTLLLPGMQIGDYSIIQKIANGGFGAVYSAESNKDSKNYALKILNKSHRSPIKAIQREIEIAVMLNNSTSIDPLKSCYFPKIHDSGETENFIYYVSELLGPSLDSLVGKQDDASNGQSTSFRIKILKYAKEMLLCLKTLHSMQIVHCDVKPANFLFGNDIDHICLTDFGLSKIVKNTKIDPKINIQNITDFFGKLLQNSIKKADKPHKTKHSQNSSPSKKRVLLSHLSNNSPFKNKITENLFSSPNDILFKKKKNYNFKGTYKYASFNTLNGGIIGPRDDLISWFYSILEIYAGSPILPWESLVHEINVNNADLFNSDLSYSSSSESNSNKNENPLFEMKKMKEYFESDINIITMNYSFDGRGYILPEQLCEMAKMPIEMVSAFRCILALKSGETFYHDSCYDEIIFYIDSAIQSLEIDLKKENENNDYLKMEIVIEKTQ